MAARRGSHGGGHGGHSQSLPQLPPPHASSASASSSSSSSLSLSLAAATATGVGIGVGGGGDGPKCRGEFCRVPPSALPGLYGSSALRPRDPQDEVDNEAEDGDDGGAEEPDDALPDGGQRFKIGNNNILLARAEMDFLLGRSVGAGDVALRWQEADNIQRMELGRGNPQSFYKQVAVCANCHRVYSDLARLRERGFRMKKAKSAWHPTPSADKADTVIGKKKGTGVTTTKRLKRSSGNPPMPAPDSPSTEYYDQLFLAELARHSESDLPTGAQDTAATVSARAEHEPSDRQGPTSEPLPKLTTGTAKGPMLKKTLKLVPGTASTTSVNNQSDPTGSGIGLHSHDPRMIEELREEVRKLKNSLRENEVQRNQLEHEVVRTKEDCAAALSEKEEQLRKRMLDLELEHTNKTKTTHATPTVSSSSADEVTKLIETVDSLHLQLDQEKAARDKARREATAAHQLDIKRLREKFHVEFEALRLSEHAAKEQAEVLQIQVMQLQNEVQIAASQAKSTKAALEDTITNQVAALEEKNRRLERQIAELKVQQGKPIISSSSANTQETSAVEKHYNNKVEYLKAQLASEMKCKEELGSHLAQLTAAMDNLKKEKRQALVEQEETLKRHVERLEENFAQEKENLQSQLAHLQGKVATLQANTTDLVQELSMWKAKDSNAKLTLDKMAEENLRLNRHIVDLEGQLETLQEDRRQSGAKTTMSVKNASEETQRLQMEALLRRLDNERQYLKNQLDNEAEMKEQHQKQVAVIQNELVEVRSSLELQLKNAEQKCCTLESSKLAIERQRLDEKTVLEESKALLARQLKDIQIKFMQHREQSLLDRDEFEKCKEELSALRSQLITAQEETLREKEYGKTASDRMSKALSTIKSSLKAMEEEKNLRIKHLEDEVRIYMHDLAKSQGDLAICNQTWDAEKIALRKEVLVTRFVLVVKANCERSLSRRKQTAFWRIVLHYCAEKISRTQRRNQELARSEVEEVLKRDYIEKCEEITNLVHSERVEALKRQEEEHTAQIRNILVQCEGEKTRLEEELRRLHQQQMEELEAHYEQSIRVLDDGSAAAVSALQERCNVLQQERDDLSAAFTEAKTRIEEMAAIQVAQEKQHAQSTATLTSQHSENLTQIELSFQQQHLAQQQGLEEQILALESRHAGELDRVRIQVEESAAKKLQDLRHDLDDEKEKELQRTVQMLKKEHSEEVDTLKGSFEVEKDTLNQRWQEELNRERSQHEKQLKEAMERLETKAQSHLESLQSDMNNRKATALLQCTSKWQKAMEELQARVDAEKKVAYDSGVRDREAEWQQAAALIKQKQKEELDKVQADAIRAIQAAEERHRMILQSRTAEVKSDLETKFAEELQRIQFEVTTSEHIKAAQAVADALKVQEERLEKDHFDSEQRLRREMEEDQERKLELLKAKWTEEMEVLKIDLENHHQAQLDELEQGWMNKLNDMHAQSVREHSAQIEAAREEYAREREELRESMKTNFENELSARLKEQEEHLLSEQEDAINQVQEDSERLIEQVEAAMCELKKQKEALEQELTRLRSALEEAEDSHFDVEEKLKQTIKTSAFQVMALVMHASKRLKEERIIQSRLISESAAALTSVKNEIDTVKQTRSQDIRCIRESWELITSKHDEMQQTLSNYKRDELVAHRSASAVLTNEIGIVSRQMDEVAEMKSVLEKEIEQLQAEAHTVEANLRQLMLQGSSTTTGSDSLNMVNVAKKRRLNEEFDTLLEHIEKKKGEMRTLEKTLASLRQRREEKEGELKVMERKLVEILVGQQKQLLSILNAVRGIPAPPPLAAISS